MSLNRRRFLASTGCVSAQLLASARAGAAPPRASSDLQPVALSQVRLLDGPFLDSQRLNQRFIDSIPSDRLLHNFRVNAGLSSTAAPLGGWEKPDCELRGHFVGHYLSGCAFAYTSTGDAAYRDKANDLVTELAKCQAALGNGYLSAFPIEFFDRLNARQKVWAPFYTVHKIMAGLLDVHQLCGNEQALRVLRGMADWSDRWSAPLSHEHMQDVLNTEFGGMSETLYSLAQVTGDHRYAVVAQRFEKERFLNPLASRMDVLKGLHVNTHVPQVIAAARAFEVTGDTRYRDIADYFWSEVTGKRCYCTGGTSNDEEWMTAPGELAQELPLSTNTEECCVAYNMLKLTRHLYRWSGDPRYLDYYERVLFNHRLGTLDPQSGSGMYYLPLHSNSWKVFGSNYDSFWCCTGTGVEEHAKLNDSIYFHDPAGILVNLFIPSEWKSADGKTTLRQETRFPDVPTTALVFQKAPPARLNLRVRAPGWASGPAICRVNGKIVHKDAQPGSYVSFERLWKDGDRVEITFPSAVRAVPLLGDARMFALMAGPIVLAGRIDAPGPTRAEMVNGSGPALHQDAAHFDDPGFAPEAAAEKLKPVPGEALTFRAGDVTFSPLSRVYDQRYGVYWRAKEA